MATIGLTYFGDMIREKGKTGAMTLKPKKCPNCGAPLDYKYGDTSAHCTYCRSNFAIEYENEKPKRYGVTMKEACEAIERLTKVM